MEACSQMATQAPQAALLGATGFAAIYSSALGPSPNPLQAPQAHLP